MRFSIGLFIGRPSGCVLAGRSYSRSLRALLLVRPLVDLRLGNQRQSEERQRSISCSWHYKEYQHEQPTQERLVYAQEEENAKVSRVGLWKGANPVPPWEWRKPR
jgi:hypothetical protein